MRNTKNQLFVHHRGREAGVLSEVFEEKTGGMGGNGGKWREMGVASECCAIWCTVYSSHLFYMVLQPAFLGCPAIFCP